MAWPQAVSGAYLQKDISPGEESVALFFLTTESGRQLASLGSDEFLN